MFSHFHISLYVHNLSLPQVSVVLHSTQFNVACRGTCPLIDFSFIFSSLLVSLSFSFSLSSLPLPVFILHIRHDPSLLLHTDQPSLKRTVSNPSPHKQISHSYWPVSLSDPVWVFFFFFFCGIDREANPREDGWGFK